MGRLLLISICLVAALSMSSAADVEVDDIGVPVIETSTGAFRGKRIDINPYLLPDYHASVAAYTRIPYAEPPVGDLRFRRPVPKVVEGEFDATRTPVACSQTTVPLFDIRLERMEDCLYLDVYVPEPKPSNAAVMIWIHGGAFTMGAASIPHSLPTPLVAMNDVIVVAINYRLNVFGFLGTGDEDMPFNLGMLDQVQGMKWVQENIAAFGGDPSRVTIFGESAGSMSVHLHVLSPMSADLFHGAIMQSGTAIIDYAVRTTEAGVDMTTRFGQVMNCSDDVTVVTCLREKSAEDFVNYFQNDPMAAYEFMLGPTIDGAFIPRDPVAMSAAGEVNDVAVMAGCLTDEGTLFLMPDGEPIPEKPTMNRTSADAMIPMVMQGGDQLAVDVLTVVYADTEELNKAEPDYANVVTDFAGDSYFLCSTFTTSGDLTTAGRPVYTWLMSHVPSSSIYGKDLTWAGATHAEDLPYVFGSPFMRDTADPEGESAMIGLFNEQEVEMSKQVMKYWSNFAKTGDPNRSCKDSAGDDAYPAWPRFSRETKDYKDLSLTMDNRSGHPQPKRCLFLEDLLPKLKENAAEMSRLKSLLEEKVNSDTEKSCEDPASCPEEE